MLIAELPFTYHQKMEAPTGSRMVSWTKTDMAEQIRQFKCQLLWRALEQRALKIECTYLDNSVQYHTSRPKFMWYTAILQRAQLTAAVCNCKQVSGSILAAQARIPVLNRLQPRSYRPDGLTPVPEAAVCRGDWLYACSAHYFG